MRNVKALVEGYHDRAFLSGWLKSLGFVDPGLRSSGSRKPVINPVTNEKVVGGNFAWLSPSEAVFVELVPTGGYERMLSALPGLIRRAPVHDPDELLVVLDLDDSDLVLGSERRAQSVLGALAQFSPVQHAANTYVLSTGLLLKMVFWGSMTAAHAAVPGQHNLERVVCGALARVFPLRASAVAAWLEARPGAPKPDSSKAHTWSFMAGWYAERGCEGFLTTLWDDPQIANALTEDLRATGAEAIIRDLA